MYLIVKSIGFSESQYCRFAVAWGKRGFVISGASHRWMCSESGQISQSLT